MPDPKPKRQGPHTQRRPPQERPSRSLMARTLRDKRIVELRMAGATYQEIAEAVGFTEGHGAYDAWRRIMKQTRTSLQESAAEAMALEADRIDRLFRVAWTRAIGSPARKQEDGTVIPAVPPSKQWMDRAVKLMQRRAELLGLDAPKKTIIGGSPDPDAPPPEPGDALPPVQVVIVTKKE